MAAPTADSRFKKLFFADGGLPLIWIALTGIALYPVWRARLLPLLDLPNHLGLARGWHDYHDPSSRVAEFYQLRIRVVPYFLFYGTIHLLLYVVPIEIANKLFLSAYLILFPLSVLALARALHRSSWLALFAFPLCFNQNWIYGFASYLMSVTFSLFALAALLRYLETRRLVYAIALGICCVVSYLGHIMPWALFGLCAVGILATQWRRWQAALLAAVVMLPSLMLAVTAILDEQGEHTYMKDSTFAGTFHDFPTLALAFPKRVMELFPGNFDAFLLVVLVCALIALWVLPYALHEQRGDDRDAMRVIKICLCALGVAYVSLPYAITKPMSWWYVTPRIPSLMMVFLVLSPRVQLTGLRRLALLPVIFCAIALPLKLAKLYRNFSARNLPMIRMVEELPRGAPTLVVVRNMMRGPGSEEKSGDPASSGPVYWHFSSWPMALKGGYGPYLFDQGIPLRPKKPLTAPSWGNPDAFIFRQGPEFEYYIVRDATDEMDREPSVKLLKRVADWSLYQRTSKITEEP
jgi:hypothetical protein